MIKDRGELELHIAERIKEVKSSRKKVNQINKYLLEYGVPIGTFEDISKGNQSLESLTSALLCIVTSALYDATRYEDMKPDNFYTENEIEKAKNTIKYAYKDETRLHLPLEIEDVTYLGDASYITKIDMKFLVQLFHSQLIKYDFDTQRSAKFVKRRDGIVAVPDINIKSVEDIAESMVNETYLEDMITLNMYSDEIEAIEYNTKTRTLRINEQAIISILDGFHRLQGGVRAVSMNPNLKQRMILSIRSYDTLTAQRYFGQINTINPVKIERRKELLSDQPSDLVVRDLQLKSDLKGKIASAPNISGVAKQLTTFDIMSYAIANTFNPTSKMEAKETAEYLTNFYDYLVGSFVDEFLENPQNYKESNINHPLMFIGYTIIAKYFKDNNIHPREVKNYVSRINFKDSDLIGLLESKVGIGINTPSLRKKVLVYFKSLVATGGEE
ncbi:DNA sulfur modification protein DndB [Paenibacillus sp. GCM10012306]|uniref:DNA sulfur modification protein DndB n=1 Tax=Paenibacillus sp. GCM10012306 TaxID=3317342 RepID=UPI00361E329D